ncbi:WD repeat-containing protein 87-like isoform X2 [Macrotis lagotis]|uniref:WD repeat-containing protein 87-like isoform X2 n=1 Tax=Macrotis lagotis TaxID=92651 RepID=UPI003D694472
MKQASHLLKASHGQEDDILHHKIILSDSLQIVYQESCYPHNIPPICHYSLDTSYFVSFSWVQTGKKDVHTVLWMYHKTGQPKVEKREVTQINHLPPVMALLHADVHRVLIAYCDDMILRIFGDHSSGFKERCVVPCRFSISCLAYHQRTGLLLSGIAGAVVTWVIEPGGKGLHVLQILNMSGSELVQGINLDGPENSLLAMCESFLRILVWQGHTKLVEEQTFSSPTSGHSLTCCCTCLSEGYLFGGNKAGQIHIWNLDPSFERRSFSFQAHTGPVVLVRSLAKIHTLLTVGAEGRLKERHIKSGSLLCEELSICEDVLYSLQFVDDSTFFCQSQYSFFLYHMSCFYQLFNNCGASPRHLQCIHRGSNQTLIFCCTDDGLFRFLCPITGNLLFLTWPFSSLDKAVSSAYDPENKELFVAMGNVNVIIFDTTHLCPNTSFKLAMTLKIKYNVWPMRSLPWAKALKD